jgi:hypothetical protein
MRSLLLFFPFLLLSQLSLAQVKFLEADQTAGKGDLNSLDWIVGYWEGEAFGGTCEEVWMPEVDGHMVGTFRMWSEGKLVFSEFMNIVQEGDTFTMKLKHFNRDLSGWEEKEKWTTFRLVEVGEDTVWFSGLTMIRTGDEIKLHIAMTENGVRTIEELTYRKGKF